MVIILVKCKECGRELPSTDFSPGLLKHRICRSCKNEKTKKYNKANRDKKNKYDQNYRASNPEVIRAMQTIKRAKSDGRIFETPCVVCGEEKVVAHHSSHFEKEVIIWVCQLHNKQLHSGELKLIDLPITKAKLKSPLDVRDPEINEKLLSHCEKPLETVLLGLFNLFEGKLKEVENLTRKEVQFESNKVHVGKRVTNDQTFKKALEEYISSRTDDDLALLVTERSPRKMNIWSMRYVIKRVGKRAGIEGILPKPKDPMK